MTERRAIKTSIWSDEWFGELSPIAMLLWIGMFSKCADNQGRIREHAVLLRSEIFIFQDTLISASEITDLLKAFERAGKIIRYEANGKKYIQIVDWWDMQPLQYAVPSKYPAPVGWLDRYRTTYKNIYIVFNWPGSEDNAIGRALASYLGSAGSETTWSDHLETLNLNLNPTPEADADADQKIAAAKPPELPAGGGEVLDGGKKSGPPPNPLKRAGGDSRLNHPAIKLVKSVTGYYPKADDYDNVIRCLGESPSETKLRKVFEVWCARGNNPVNVAGLMDWYKGPIPAPVVQSGTGQYAGAGGINGD